ncbi:dynein regulatory complex protein 10 [Parambassis ranga]|uniref:Dynein regulatory complex protein 10 n=1 Tax=Parambassis ranga TaxID=210632 RepID=A0A6P7IY32_9TELE|nr:kinesin-like protein KIF21A [Parambassis ranga]
MSENGKAPSKKLSPEAQCISNILEQCISQLEIAAALPTVLCSNSISAIEDQDLSRKLQVHQTLSERLLKLEQGQERKTKRVQLEKHVKFSVRNVLRAFLVHPDAILGLRKKSDMAVGESEGLLIRNLRMFHSYMVHSLLTSVKEELQLSKHLSLLKEEEEEEEEDEEVEEEGGGGDKSALETTDAEISHKNSEIIMQEQDAPPPTDKQGLLHTKTISPQLTSIQQEIDQLNIQLNNLMLTNRQAEALLQEKNEQVEMETEYVLKHFDDEIEEIQAKLESNENGYVKENEEVRELEEPFSLLEMECNKIQERQRLAEEKRIEQLRELELKAKAALPGGEDTQLAQP